MLHCILAKGDPSFSTDQSPQIVSVDIPSVNQEKIPWTGLATMEDPNAPTTSPVTTTAQTNRCFLDPSGPSVPTVYQGSATLTAGPTTAPKVNGPPVTLQDGLRYVDIKGGSGPVAKSGSTVTVNYTGWLVSTCQKFDSSYDSHPDQSGRAQPPQPLSVQLGKGMVIQGWEEGLIGMKSGGLRRLFIPSALAYGDQGAGPIPPNADLIFDVQMVSAN